MKKRLFTIFALSTLLSLSVCNSSCSKDEDDDAPEQVDNNNNEGEKPGNENQPAEGEAVNKEEAKKQADAITNSIKEVLAANRENSPVANDKLNNLIDNIKDVQFAGNAAQTQEIISQVSNATGLDATTIGALMTGEKPSDFANIIGSISDEQVNNIIGEDNSMAQALADASELQGPFLIVADETATYEQRLAALDALEASVIKNYRNSTNETYKKAYVEGVAAATGLSPVQAEMILNTESPKATIIALLNIKDNSNTPGGDEGDNDDPNISSQDEVMGQQDGLVAAEFMKSLNGKTLAEVSGDLDTFMAYREKYMNGSNEYKESFKATLQAQGINKEVTDAFDKEDVDVMSLALALGVRFF